jgi:phage terminase large subunit-like protein
MYRPYPKQRLFHQLGTDHRERCLLAANQSGKTRSAGAEVGFHTTGLYPDWWEGRRYTHPTRWWVGCTSSEMTRDNPQRILLGPPGHWGEGPIPNASILEMKRSRTTSEGIDILQIKHKLGGASQITFKSYEQRREKWQGETLHGVWYDEEPPQDLYMEGLTRTNATKGMTMLTATPLLGMTAVVRRFYPEPDHESRAIVQMHLEDCRYEDGPGHYTDAEIAAIVSAYPEHERDARAKGVPMLGSGRIFPVAEAHIEAEPFEIPGSWARMGAIDFGWDHPTAAVEIAWDREGDVLFVTNCYKRAERTPAHHCMTLRRWHQGMPWAWPHDGWQHDKGSGKTLADQYRGEGLRMLREHATFPDGGFGLEAGLQEMLDRMQTGRFKVWKHLEEWWAEFRLYHRKDGKVVKEGDDLMAATRVAVMAKRFARAQDSYGNARMPSHVGLEYNPLDRKPQQETYDPFGGSA